MKRLKVNCKLCNSFLHSTSTHTSIDNQKDSSPSSFETKFPSLRKLGYKNVDIVCGKILVKRTYVWEEEDIIKGCLDKSIVERNYITRKEHQILSDELVKGINKYWNDRMIEKQKDKDFLRDFIRFYNEKAFYREFDCSHYNKKEKELMKGYTAKVLADKEDLVLQLPKSLIKDYKLKPNDAVTFIILDKKVYLKIKKHLFSME